MTNKLCILFLFTLNLINFNGYNINSYRNLEEKVSTETKFVENGVKVEYKTEKSVKEEEKRIKNELGKNSIVLKENLNVDFSLWEENNTTYISAKIINQNKENSTKELKEILSKLTNNDSKDVRFFEYYKGSLNENKADEYIKELEKETTILKIENGYTGKIKLGKDNVNVGLINYDTGLNLIIGTPVIFTTY